MNGLGKNAVIVLALLAAGFLAAWLRLRPHLAQHATYTDGVRTYESLRHLDVRHAVWDDPRPLAGEVNTRGHEGRPALSPDGRFLVLAVGRPGVDADLWIARLEHGAAVDARPLAALNTEHDELAPAFGAGELWFASNRPGGAGGLDLYRAPFEDGEVGNPRRAHPSLQSRADDTDPAPLPGGGGLVFASNRGGRAGGFELYLARALDGGNGEQGFAVEPIEALSSPADEREPALTSDGRSLFMASDRDARGVFRLYRSLLEGGAWLPPEPVAGLPAGARGPAPAGDGFTLLFARPGEQGGSDIWRARSIELLRRPARPAGWLDAALLAALLLLALLAWLAKRWERLDVLYKAFLVSLLAHLGLLLWTRGVDTASQAPELELQRTFEVRLARPAGPAPRDLERGGRLELASPTRPAAEAPERRQLARAPQDAGDPATPEPAPPDDRPLQLEPLLGPSLAPAPRVERVAASLRAMHGTVEPLEGGPAAAQLELTARAPAPSIEAASARRRRAPGEPERRRLDPPAVDTALTAPPRAALDPALDARSEHGLSAADIAPPPALPASIPVRSATMDTGDAGERPSQDPAASRGLEDPGDLALLAPRPWTTQPTRPLPRERAAPGAGPARWQAAREEALPAGPAPATLEVPLPMGQALAPRTPAVPRTPYALRFGAARERALEEHGGSAETEAAVAAGLAYLAGVQRPEGHWGDVADRSDKYGHVLVGKTGLCLLAFLGAGHVPGGEHGPGRGEHAGVARRAVDFLLSVQDPATGHFGYTSAYSHGIATYALAECFALSGEPRLRVPLERAVARIVQAQDRTPGDRRRAGGWGYYYPDERVFDSWPRASISAWQVMALASARLSGVEVPDGVLEAARAFLEAAWDERLGAFRYSHDPARLRSAWPTLPASTPAALFALSLLGADLSDPRFEAGRRYVLARPPARLGRVSDSDFVLRASGNLYFFYHAGLALFREGGRDWERWNEALKACLLPAQGPDGSWEPSTPYARYAGDDPEDRSYTTAMCVLSLEIYYRYFTPLLRAH